MAETFNPYHRWLGLAEGQTTPTYYEVLGVPRSEHHADRIAQAADRAMTKVRSFRPGPQAALWAKLLDEIQQARTTLLDSQLRAEYDAGQGAVSSASAPSPTAASAPSHSSAPRPPANPALYPPGMAPPGT